MQVAPRLFQTREPLCRCCSNAPPSIPTRIPGEHPQQTQARSARAILKCPRYRPAGHRGHCTSACATANAQDQITIASPKALPKPRSTRISGTARKALRHPAFGRYVPSKCRSRIRQSPDWLPVPGIISPKESWPRRLPPRPLPPADEPRAA